MLQIGISRSPKHKDFALWSTFLRRLGYHAIVPICIGVCYRVVLSQWFLLG